MTTTGFRHYMNQTMAGGRDAMTPLAVFVINVFGVWLTLAVCIAVMRAHGAGYGAFAGWLMLVNAVLHVSRPCAAKPIIPGS